MRNHDQDHHIKAPRDPRIGSWKYENRKLGNEEEIKNAQYAKFLSKIKPGGAKLNLKNWQSHSMPYLINTSKTLNNTHCKYMNNEYTKQ